MLTKFAFDQKFLVVKYPTVDRLDISEHGLTPDVQNFDAQILY
ncbi:hypothetical protein [Fischerella thermalis]